MLYARNGRKRFSKVPDDRSLTGLRTGLIQPEAVILLTVRFVPRAAVQDAFSDAGGDLTRLSPVPKTGALP